MSMIEKGNKPEITREMIEEITLRARQERAEAIKQLFGFGFTVVKNSVHSAFAGKQQAGQHPAATARG